MIDEQPENCQHRRPAHGRDPRCHRLSLLLPLGSAVPLWHRARLAGCALWSIRRTPVLRDLGVRDRDDARALQHAPRVHRAPLRPSRTRDAAVQRHHLRRDARDPARAVPGAWDLVHLLDHFHRPGAARPHRTGYRRLQHRWGVLVALRRGSVLRAGVPRVFHRAKSLPADHGSAVCHRLRTLARAGSARLARLEQPAHSRLSALVPHGRGLSLAGAPIGVGRRGVPGLARGTGAPRAGCRRPARCGSGGRRHADPDPVRCGDLVPAPRGLSFVEADGDDRRGVLWPLPVP